MVMAIRIERSGGPEVMHWTEVEVGDPGPGQARIRQTAVGLNFIDVYHRTGLYAMPTPHGLGLEASGVVEALGDGVEHLSVEDRVTYVRPPPGAYCEARLIDADALIRLPDDVSDEAAAAVMLKGMTAWYLLRRSYRVQPGDTILFHAAAGGVGLIACQWAKHLGATVIGTASTEAKAELAKAHGCDVVLSSIDDDIAARVRELTDGQGVPVSYDSVGKDTFFASLDALRTHGTLVSYGNASGPVEPFSLTELANRGSLYVTRPTLFNFIATRPELEAAANELLELVSSGVIQVRVNQHYDLRDAARAHTDLEARKTTGSTVLVP